MQWNQALRFCNPVHYQRMRGTFPSRARKSPSRAALGAINAMYIVLCFVLPLSMAFLFSAEASPLVIEILGVTPNQPLKDLSMVLRTVLFITPPLLIVSGLVLGLLLVPIVMKPFTSNEAYWKPFKNNLVLICM